MGVLRRSTHHSTALAFLLFASASVITFSLLCSGFEVIGEEKSASAAGLERDLSQNKRVGPGSSPPSCRSKCGNCAPCKPVHVPVHPGVSYPLEYYPEAWRCKCGNKLFMS